MAEKKLLTQCIQFMGLITKKISASFEQMNKLCLETIANYQKEKIAQEKQSSEVRKQLIMKKRSVTNAEDIIQRNQKRREKIIENKNASNSPYNIFMEHQIPILLQKYPLLSHQNLRLVLSQAWQKLSKQDRQVYETQINIKKNKNKINVVAQKQTVEKKEQKQIAQQVVSKKQVKQQKKMQKIKDMDDVKDKRQTPSLLNPIRQQITMEKNIRKYIQKSHEQKKGITEPLKKLKESQIIISSDQQNRQRQCMTFEPMLLNSGLQKPQNNAKGFSSNQQSDSLFQN